MVRNLKHFHKCRYKVKLSPLTPILFDIVLKVLANVKRQEKEIKGIRIVTKGLGLSLFTDETVLELNNKKTI